ncbi:MAG: strawberry notch family protein, partial [Cyanobacteria bacterium P01_D01_bin.14]
MDTKTQQALAEHFKARFLVGDQYPTITQARQVANTFLERTVDRYSAEIKQVDEAIEKAVVRASRALVMGQGVSTTHQAYDRLVDLHSRQPRLSIRTSTSIEQQAYSTPVPIAYLAANLAGIGPDTVIYEPTAGNGSLLMTTNPENAIANELNSERYAELQQHGYRQLTQHDAVDYSPGEKVADVVITNPPFGRVRDPTTGQSRRFDIGDTWSAQIDHAISSKALEAMKDEGKAVLILGSTLIRGAKDIDDYRSERYNERETRGFFFNLYRRYNVIDHFSIDGRLYAKQGAGFPIDVIVIDGRRKDLDAPFVRPLPAAEVPHLFTRFDTLKEKLPNVPLSHLSQDLDAPGPAGRAGGEGAGGVPTDQRADLPRADGAAADLADLAGVGDSGPEPGSDPAAAGPVRSGNGPNSEPPRPTGDDRTRRASDVVPGLGTNAGSGQRGSTGGLEPGSAARAAPDESQLNLFHSAGTSRLNPPQHLARRSAALAGILPMREKATDAVEAPKEQTQVPYVPRSQGRSMNTLIPRNMASSAQVALGRLEQQHGNIDEFVRARLGYTSTDELHRRLYAEQIDNIGLAISNLNKGNGFVIGDQTGIGKGCQCAALMSYGARQGKPVVFLTQKSALYKDILRDLDTIGVRDFTPFITDSNAKITVEGGSVLRTGSNAQQDQEMKRLMGLGNLGSYDAVFTTYSQIQTVKQEEPFRRDFLRSLAERGAVFICDESHEAGGSPQTGWQRSNAPLTRAEFMRELIDTALESGGGVVYSSATYSKRPDVMDLYARSTDLRYAVGKNRSLEVTLRVGGVPLQQVIAAKYVKSGQMMRRERSFEGISFQTLTVPADKETADQFSAAMRAINSFD